MQLHVTKGVFMTFYFNFNCHAKLQIWSANKEQNQMK